MARIWKFGKDIDTDQIVPGRYAPYMLKEGQDVKDFAFCEARPAFAKQAQPGDIIVADENFGCGSSREYAPEALRRRQIGAIIAPSFARIFFRNAINLGIPLYVSSEANKLVSDGEEVTLDVANNCLHTATTSLTLPSLPSFAQEIAQAGGIVPFVRAFGRFPGEDQ
ncbi:homoaconitate hydratase [Candidatus Leptofilum sp.]|uniref:LeuD/DmdB family oxidoreductase small subunit n=1 Tax=Candidatus Leptofilum sp. TaxID=3241576 RepID=UPI003B591E5B